MGVAQSCRESLETLMAEMQPVLLACGVPEEQARVANRRLKPEGFGKAFDWLHQIKMSEGYKKALKAWKLVSPDTWKMYAIQGFEGMQEQLLLEKAAKELLPLWKQKRPSIFGKDRPRDKETTDQDTDRGSPEGKRVRSRRARPPKNHHGDGGHSVPSDAGTRVSKRSKNSES